VKEIKLPSGAVLKITVSPFADSKALYQAILEEFKKVDFKTSTDMETAIKDMVCLGFSSKKIEQCLDVCFKRCIYSDSRGDFKIDANTFEDEKAREDYVSVCIAVAKENITPFLKGLFAEFQQSVSMIQSVQT
jgi:hypothetical protein